MCTVVTGNMLEGNVGATMAELLVPSRAAMAQPVATDPYVELYCKRPRATLLPPLPYNLILLVWGACLAFLTRKLPDAFNESW